VKSNELTLKQLESATGPSKKAAEQAACQKVLFKWRTTTEFPESTDSGSRINHPNTNAAIGVPLPQGRSQVGQQQPTPELSNPQKAPATHHVELDSPEILKQSIASNRVGELQELCSKKKLDGPQYSEVKIPTDV